MTSILSESNLQLSQSQLTIDTTSVTTTEEQGLKRIGKSKDHFLYEEEKKILFYEWWRKTEWHETNENDPNKTKIAWGGEKKAIQWGCFSEGAVISSGAPMVICKLCSGSLKHPSYKNVGPSGMKSHLGSKNCNRIGVAQGSDNSLRQLSYRESVSRKC